MKNCIIFSMAFKQTCHQTRRACRRLGAPCMFYGFCDHPSCLQSDLPSRLHGNTCVLHFDWLIKLVIIC